MNVSLASTAEYSSKAAESIKDLNHKNTVSLKDGIQKTTDWMKSVYNL